MATSCAPEQKSINSNAGGLVLDPSVIAELPEGSRVVSAVRYGASFWTTTGQIHVEHADGVLQSYFIKIVFNDNGLAMVQGEFESMAAIYAVLPDFAPKPISYGSYESSTDTHFFLCEYRDMKLGQMPQPDIFGARLAALHKSSKSPNGKFGFHIPTYSGNLPQKNEWEDKWEVFFASNLRWAIDCEIQAKGPDSQFDALVPAIFEKVIPRLLRPLETEGRSVKPSLVHGDLWYANSGVDVKTNKPLIFDACCFYAHNEYEFGQWMPVCNRFGPEYLAAYQSYNDISEPKEDYDGRLDLYKLRFNTHVSALFPDNLALREQMLNDMRSLVNRYG
ncbi:Fructosamine kinase-domain-containing protein [Aspergillus ambiguus]|uniref:Fructosamine kinase-domain-containing protein n=1 Tax=Aspergillus ambiguus TaxID=176160 RepID=UPI003CCE4EA3